MDGRDRHENWPKRFPRRSVVPKAAAGHLYLVELAGETVGTVTFQWSDPRFWGDAGEFFRNGSVLP